MAIVIEGQPNPQRIRHDARVQRLEAARALVRGRLASELTSAERDAIVGVVLDLLGWTDATGRVR